MRISADQEYQVISGVFFRFSREGLGIRIEKKQPRSRRETSGRSRKKGKTGAAAFDSEQAVQEVRFTIAPFWFAFFFAAILGFSFFPLITLIVALVLIFTVVLYKWFTYDDSFK